MNTTSELPSTTAKTPYFYLWHLAALKVIDGDFSKSTLDNDIDEDTYPHITNTLWDRLNACDNNARKARVALIDVGASKTHPNLLGRVSAEDSIDLCAHPYGAKMESPPTAGITYEPKERSAQYFENLSIESLSLSSLDENDKLFLEAFIVELRQSEGVVRKFGEVEERFSSHGTAVAGLIVGGPSIAENEEEGDTGHCLQDTTQILPYFGVDPDSTLISIRTSFDNDPSQFLAALLYAWMKNADVIVLPRGLPDPYESPLQPKTDLLASLELWSNREQNDLYHRTIQSQSSSSDDDPNSPILSETTQRGWRLVKELLVEISKSIPIVCAAGNEGESQLIYPACLADRENGIIAVGAVSAEGYRSGYSNYGEGLTVVAPSDDMEVLNRHQTRLDWSNPETEERHGAISETALELPMSTFGLLSTDLPGHYGYDGEQQNRQIPHKGFDEETELYENGYYTLFGGTSGACALVGGVIALIRRAEYAREPSSMRIRDGRDIKELLQWTARIDTSVVAGGRPLTVDRMNSNDEDANAPKYFFGAGLVDAKAALKAVFPELFNTD